MHNLKPFNAVCRESPHFLSAVKQDHLPAATVHAYDDQSTDCAKPSRRKRETLFNRARSYKFWFDSLMFPLTPRHLENERASALRAPELRRARSLCCVRQPLPPNETSRQGHRVAILFTLSSCRLLPPLQRPAPVLSVQRTTSLPCVSARASTPGERLSLHFAPVLERFFNVSPPHGNTISPLLVYGTTCLGPDAPKVSRHVRIPPFFWKISCHYSRVCVRHATALFHE